MITLQFFHTATRDRPGLTAHSERVQELLERYVALSNNLVKLSRLTRSPFRRKRTARLVSD